MLAYLSGEVAAIASDSLLVELSTGLGYKVFVPNRILSAAHLGAKISLHTSLIVREDSLTLFGFTESDDRDCFEMLQSVSGIGPKVAASALSLYPAEQLLAAIAGEDSASLEKISGLGKKGAARIIIDLKQRASELSLGKIAPRREFAAGKWESELTAALIGLGYPARAAEAMLQDLIEVEGDALAGVALPQLLKMTLALRGGGR